MPKQFLILVVFNMFFINAQQHVTICWDASYSMLTRNLESELTYLDDYFSENPNSDVGLIVFNNSIEKKENFKVENGDWNLLKEILQHINYDGATSFKALNENITSQTIFLFTDGIQSIDIETFKVRGNLNVVNSNAISNSDNLKEIAKLNHGIYIDLNDKSELINKTNNYNLKINGDVAFFDNLKIINTENNTTVDVNKFGEYALQGKLGDTLKVKKDDKVLFRKALDENRNLNIWVNSEEGTIALNEVLLTEKALDAGDEIKMTANGLKSSRSIGYASQTLSNDDLMQSAPGNKISEAIVGKVSGVQYNTKTGNDNLSRSDLSKIVIRNGNNSINAPKNALIILDGVPIYNESVDNLINSDNVLDVTVLKGLAATNRFGSDANSGAVLIRTKSGSSGGGAKRENTALLKNNIYEETLESNLSIDSKTYIEALESAGSMEKAYTLYLKQRLNFKDLPSYYLEVYDFFKKGDQKKAVLILSNILENERATLMELKATLFKFNEAQNFPMALVTANKIQVAFPDRTQSYVDVAIAYKNSGNYQVALDLFNKINSGVANPNLNFSGVNKTVIREIKDLVFNHNKGLKLSPDNKIFLETNNVFNARIVVEWSRDDAEFELQFVNPSKRFFKWQHTVSGNRDRMKDEFDNGYSIEEFEIVGGNEIKGEWIINVEYFGNINKEETLTYLNCKVYYNFGKANQRDKSHIVRLEKVGSQAELFKLKI